MHAMATSHGSTDGQTTISTPKAMNVTPGIAIIRLVRRFSIMSLHVSAIGHIGMASAWAIFGSLGRRSCLCVYAASIIDAPNSSRAFLRMARSAPWFT
ncbi:MAG TPA: hypothetical protein VD840_15685, partial [Sinorhizobium sp.]|nr:hypothetical protein [Sinorhizobium sp.]